MYLKELFDKEREEEQLEESGAKPVWARSGGKPVKKFRCTSGQKQGRLVSDPADCGKAKDLKKSVQMSKTRKQKEKKMGKKAKRTKKTNPASIKMQKMNKALRKK